jgi:hypothetical protein
MFKCFLNVARILPECPIGGGGGSLGGGGEQSGVPEMLPEWFLNVPCMFPDTSFGLVNSCLGYSCGQVVFCVKLDTFF